jgi:hypothetical protein
MNRYEYGTQRAEGADDEAPEAPPARPRRAIWDEVATLPGFEGLQAIVLTEAVYEATSAHRAYLEQVLALVREALHGDRGLYLALEDAIDDLVYSVEAAASRMAPRLGEVLPDDPRAEAVRRLLAWAPDLPLSRRLRVVLGAGAGETEPAA